MEINEINHILEQYDAMVKNNNQIVTVFVLTHKRPYYLTLAVNSMLRQTYDNFCLIILDNMSCDQTRESVEKIDDKRLLYVERDGSKGTSNSSFAFSVCKTKYMVIFHDDDLIDSHYLEKMVAVMESNPNYTILSCCYDNIDAEGNTISPANPTGSIYTYFGNDYLIKYITGQLPLYVLYPSILYRADFFKKIELFLDYKAGPCVDEYLYYQIGRYGGTIAIIDKLLFHYRRHSSQDSAIKGGWMGVKLLNYMFLQDYYCEILRNYTRELGLFIEASLSKNFSLYLFKKIGRQDIKKAFSLIPRQLKNANKVSTMKFSLFVHFPTTICFIYKLFRHHNYLRMKSKFSA